MNEQEIKKRRTRWKCRRGILELDVFLENYFDKYYETLNQKQRDLFEKLLDMDDTKLNAWLLKIETPEDEEIKLMINAISAATSDESN